jgi:signal transduction histidine kinase
MNKIKFKNSISTSLLIFIIILFLICTLVNIFITNFSVDMYYMNDLRNYMEEQQLLIKKNYDNVESLSSEYTIYDIRLEQYDTLKNEIIYSSRDNREGISISSKLSQEEINSIFENLLEKKEYNIFTIENDKYDIINNLLDNDTQQIIMLSKYSENNYFVLQIPSPNIIYATSLSKKYSILTMMISFILIIPIALFFSYFFTKPIKKILNVTQKIKNKDFSEKCKIDSENELGILANSINEMSNSIQTYIIEIEQKNIQLEKDIEIKKQFEESQKKFVSDVSHEIKTPISIISAYTESIKLGLMENPEDLNEYCDIILDECNRMSSIVKQLLHLSKLENNIKKLNITDFNIVQLVKDDVKKFELKFKNNNISFSLFADNNNINVLADKNEIENVLINYLQNAFKYCDNPGIIEIYIKENKNDVYIGIYNNGNQFNDNEKEKIWNRFYKEDKARTREEDSTGLGLSIVKAIMMLHEMPFGVKNKKNGVEFYIKLKKHIKNI